jgi:hypothetical protein
MAAKLLIALDLCKKIIMLWSEVGENNTASLLNGQQCILLSKKLFETQDAPERVSLHEQFQQETGSPNVGPAIQELLHVLLRAHATLSENYSCGDKWIEVALRQGGDVKETFCEICMTYSGVDQYFLLSSSSGRDQRIKFLKQKIVTGSFI